MSLTREEVEHIALLARLNLSEEEKERYRQQLSSILDHIAQLSALDTTDVQPFSSVIAEHMPLRADQPDAPLPLDRLLQNAPAAHAAQFRVPPILDGEPETDEESDDE